MTDFATSAHARRTRMSSSEWVWEWEQKPGSNPIYRRRKLPKGGSRLRSKKLSLPKSMQSILGGSNGGASGGASSSACVDGGNSTTVCKATRSKSRAGLAPSHASVKELQVASRSGATFSPGGSREDAFGDHDSGDGDTGTAEASPIREHRLQSGDTSQPRPSASNQPNLVRANDQARSPSSSSCCVTARDEGGEFVSVTLGIGTTSEFSLSLLPEVGGGMGERVVPRGAKVQSMASRTGATSISNVTRLVCTGDVLTEVNGRDVRRLPFTRVLDLLEAGAHSTPNKPGACTRPSGIPTNPSAGGRPRLQTLVRARSGMLPPAPPSPEGPSAAPPASAHKTAASNRSPVDKQTRPWHPRLFAAEGGADDSKPSFLGASTPITPLRVGLPSKMNPWGGGTPGGGKKTPLGRIRGLRRAFSFGVASPSAHAAAVGPVERSFAPLSPAAAVDARGGRKLEAVAVHPAPMTTLRFSKALETKASPRRPGRDFFREEEDEEMQERSRLSMLGERNSNSSTFFGGSEDGSEEGDGLEVLRSLDPLYNLEASVDADVVSRDCDTVGRDSGSPFFAARSQAPSNRRETELAAPAQAAATVTVAEVAERARRQEQEEDEVVSLLSYLSRADRGFPWKGEEIIWAEYVSLSGRHRWLRSDGCRHALLLVAGCMYLLELPSDAADRHNTQGLATRAAGGWILKITASSLRSVSVPLKSSGGLDSSSGVSGLIADENTVPGQQLQPHDQPFHAHPGTEKGEMVIHAKSGSCLWIECSCAGSRDALSDLVKAWHDAEVKTTSSPLTVHRLPLEQALSNVPRGGSGRLMASLLPGKQAHDLW